MNLYEIEVLDNNNQTISLNNYKDQVLLIVNTATDCEFTEQYDDLEELYEKYHNYGFCILDFPCNQFGEQAPGTMEEIMSFCADTYGVSFPQFWKAMHIGRPSFRARPLGKQKISRFPHLWH